MVSDGDGRHPKLRRAAHQAVDLTSAVKETVIGMKMKMHKVFGWHAATILTETALPRNLEGALVSVLVSA
jgi:hypothetical protein